MKGFVASCPFVRDQDHALGRSEFQIRDLHTVQPKCIVCSADPLELGNQAQGFSITGRQYGMQPGVEDGSALI